MKKNTLCNIIRRSLLTLCLMTSVTMAWAVSVTDEESFRTALSGQEERITLTQNIALRSTLGIERSVTIDLNGYTISANGFRAIWIKIGENVALVSDKPAAVTAGGSIEDDKSVIRVGDNDGGFRNVGLTIGENVTIYTDRDNCYGITIFGSATREKLDVNGKISTTGRSAISGNGSSGYGNTTITIGESAEISTSNDVAIYQPQSGTLTINGTVTGAGGIEMKSGNLVVGPDAKISATAQPSHTPNNNGTSTRGYAIAIVESAGGYEGVYSVKIDADAVINGPIAMLVDSEHTGTTPPDFSGSEVQMNVSVTSGGDVKQQFVSLLDALKEAPEGATITLLNDVDITKAAVIEKDNIILDLNGRNLTATGCSALMVKNAGASITGSGTITATGIVNPDWAVIQVGESASAHTAGLTVGKNVSVMTNDCYGITTAGTGESNLTVNGTVSTKVRPAIYSTNKFATTIGTNAHITTTDEVAVYSTGASLTVSGHVKGLSAIETKSGTLTINDAALIATGSPSHTLNNNGSSTRGYAVAMVKNNNFTPGVTEVTFTGTNTISGPVATLIDSGTAEDPTFIGITMLADINGEHYSSVVDATNIVPSDGTVKLMQNLDLTAPLSLERHATYKLDLDGHAITATDCSAIKVKSGDVILTNSNATAGTISSTGTVDATKAVIHVGDDSGENRNISLGIDKNVTVSTTLCNGILLSGTNTRESLTVKGTVSTTSQPAIAGDKSNGGTTINIEEDACIKSTGNVAIYHPQTGTLTVDGSADHKAVVSGTTGIEMKAGDLIVGEHVDITGSAGSATHTANDAAPSTSGYGIAIIENENFEGVGNVDIETTSVISASVSVAMLVDSKHAAVAEPEFIGNVVLVAEVNGTNTDRYAKLEDAFKQAVDGNTVKLLEDATVGNTLTINQAITIDINDYTITGTQTEGYVMATLKDVTVKNGGIVAENVGGISSSAGNLTLQDINVRASANSLNLARATATIDAASMLTSTSDVTVAVGDGSTLTVNGKLYNTNYTTIHSSGSTASSLTVNNSAIVSAASGYAICWKNTGSLTLNGGQMHGTTAAVYADKGKVTINGGTLTGTNDALVVNNESAGDCNVTVEHGTFNSGTGIPVVSNGANKLTGFVKGDYFSKAIDQELCATGYMISPTTNSNGMYYLVSELVITDATIWNVPTTSYTIHTAKYIRNTGMGMTRFGTLCLPFSFSNSDASDMKFYSVNRIESNTLYLDIIDGVISAGTPVIFERTGANLETSFTIESSDAEISDADPINGTSETINLVGRFTAVTINEGLNNIYYLNDDHFHQADVDLTVPAFRAYIQISASGPSPMPGILNICTDESEVNGLDEFVLNEMSEEEIFDFHGNRQVELKPGFNIVKKNGRMIKVYVNK